MSVKKILISQQQPMTASPYDNIAAKFGVEFTFKPFFKMEPLSSREFRTQRINILDHTAIIFSARTTIDAFFQLCEELRVKVPETMKYFCTTEAVANYLQKHIVYRKRKIFFGDGTPSSILNLIGNKHKDESFLIATSESSTKDAVTRIFETQSLSYETAVFVKPVSQNLKDVNFNDFDMVVMFNPADVKSLYENHPEFEQGDIRFVAYGKSIIKPMEDAGLKIEISAPTHEAPSVAKALEIYLSKNNN
ncbi:MAG: uroporphyrinogen-III synthase [Bacteroidales bacterium]|nr:uroporphyrinogen-III synthase [Bacteroidales bacterium]MDD5911462.1 uroporphyrinogen-III synthase [Bacteroidales bacterium]